MDIKLRMTKPAPSSKAPCENFSTSTNSYTIWNFAAATNLIKITMKRFNLTWQLLDAFISSPKLIICTTSPAKYLSSY